MKDSPSLAIEPHADGAVLAIKAHAGARRNGLAGQHAGALRVSVTQAPEKGKANKAIIDVLSGSLGLRKNQFELLSGETAAVKRYLVREISATQLLARIASALREMGRE